jgi:DNA-binding NarL/FixJ family response regulator
MQPVCPLTEKELSVVKWLADGHTVPEIADLEHRLPSGIHTRIVKSRNKTGTATLAGLVAMALRHGWIS